MLASGLSVKSRFTYKDLAQMRTIALIDLDAFYAQVEAVRLDLGPDIPLAVQQWNNLIAVSYSARTLYGITRHETVQEAVKKYPELKLVHVATYKQGDSEACYWTSEQDNITVKTHKVSLDVYRRESLKVLNIFRQGCDCVEKASIDESYMDLSNKARDLLYEQYSYIKRNPDNTAEYLPDPPQIVWGEDVGHIINPENPTTLDWDDVLLYFAAQQVASIRKEVFEKLKYTCSAGIASNKMLAKLAAGYKKPNQQCILRSSATLEFLGEFKFTKIQMLGGKLGNQISQLYGKELVKDYWDVSLNDFKLKLGEETGTWFYNIIRGISDIPVEPKSKVKSMLSTKQFRPYLSTHKDISLWFPILATDLYNRLIEHRMDNPTRWPKTLTLHYSLNFDHHSKSIHFPPFPRDGNFTMNHISDLAEMVWTSLQLPTSNWKCNLLSIALSGFEELEEGQRGINEYFNRVPKKRSLDEEDPQKEDFEGKYICDRCGRKIILLLKQEHDDEHFARDILEQDRRDARHANANQKVKTTRSVKSPKHDKQVTKKSNVSANGGSTVDSFFMRKNG